VSVTHSSVVPARRDHDHDGEWQVRGQPLRDAPLRSLLATRLEEAAELAGEPAPPAELADYATAEAAIESAVGRLDSRLEALGEGRARAIIGVLRELVGLQARLQVARAELRQQTFADVQRALARLRSVGSIESMLRLIPEEVCRCGFDRAMISRVRDSLWVPEAFHAVGDPDWGAEIVAAGQRDPKRLDHMVLETELVRRRGPILVHDAQADPRVHPELKAATQSRSYVAAPLMPEGRVIGFLHADCYMSRRHVDEFDRDVLWMLAEGIGYAFERTVLQERLRSLRGRVRELTDSIGGVVDEFVDAEVEVERIDLAAVRQTAPAMARVLVREDSQMASLLTRRELEIIRMMAEGNTNARIAERLVISDGTVKTHVKHILRKLRAENRVEAVSKFLRMTGERPSSDG
jgi:DNA-binding CsgD family transcriptional regulator